MGPNKDSFLSKQERKKTPNGVFHPLPPPTSRSMPSQSPSNSYHPDHHITSSRSFLLLSMLLSGIEHPCSQFGSSVPAMSPPNFLPTPAYSLGGPEWGKEKALTLCKYCSATAKIPLCYQQF